MKISDQEFEQHMSMLKQQLDQEMSPESNVKLWQKIATDISSFKRAGYSPQLILNDINVLIDRIGKNPILQEIKALLSYRKASLMFEDYHHTIQNKKIAVQIYEQLLSDKLLPNELNQIIQLNLAMYYSCYDLKEFVTAGIPSEQIPNLIVFDSKKALKYFQPLLMADEMKELCERIDTEFQKVRNHINSKRIGELEKEADDVGLYECTYYELSTTNYETENKRNIHKYEKELEYYQENNWFFINSDTETIWLGKDEFCFQEDPRHWYAFIICALNNTRNSINTAISEQLNISPENERKIRSRINQKAKNLIGFDFIKGNKIHLINNVHMLYFTSDQSWL